MMMAPGPVAGEAVLVSISQHEANPSASLPEQRAGKLFRENNLYVKHLPEDYDDDQLLDLFREYGKVLSCAVLKDHCGKSKHVGFVQMSTLEEATSALCLHGMETDAPKPLHVALALAKQDRQKKVPEEEHVGPLRTSSIESNSSTRSKGFTPPSRLESQGSWHRGTPRAGPRKGPPPMNAFHETSYTPTVAMEATMLAPGSYASQPGQGMAGPVNAVFQGQIVPAPAAPGATVPASDYFPQGAWVNVSPGVPGGVWYPPATHASPYMMGGWTLVWTPVSGPAPGPGLPHYFPPPPPLAATDTHPAAIMG
eukprot:jgi/Botrbrau1/20464/Bobra.145_2s0026.1